MSDPDESRAPNRRRIGGVPARPKTAALAVLTALAIWFVAINTGSVKIHLYFSTVMAPMWLVLAVALIVGGLIGWFVGYRATKRRVRRRAEQPRRRH